MEIKKYVKRGAFIVGILLFGMILFKEEPQRADDQKVYMLTDTEVFGEGLEWEVVQTFLPFFKYVFFLGNESSQTEYMISELSPLYRYLLSEEAVAKGQDKHIELAVGTEMENQIMKENAEELDALSDEQEEKEKKDKNRDGTEEEIETEENPQAGTEDEKEKNETNAETVFLEKSDFIPNGEKRMEYDWDNFTDSKKIREEFFAVDATTDIEDDRIMPEKLMEKEIKVSKENGGPQILIYHTHSQESFADSVPGEESTTVVGAGEYLAGLLREEYGFEVLHHTGEYDVETRDYAYSYALPNIEALLHTYPSIEVVIDLHRDAVAEDRKLVSEQNGKQAAQVMFFNGLSYTRKQGGIDYLENPYIDDNLAFSFQMQVLCNEYYPGLTRRIYLKGYRYNMHLCPQSLLVELGAQTNTCEEVRNTLDILAHVLSMCLEGEGNNP